MKIISNNTTIPVILTDDKGNITECSNVDFDEDTVKVLKGELKKNFLFLDLLKLIIMQGKNFIFIIKSQNYILNLEMY